MVPRTTRLVPSSCSFFLFWRRFTAQRPSSTDRAGDFVALRSALRRRRERRARRCGGGVVLGEARVRRAGDAAPRHRRRDVTHARACCWLLIIEGATARRRCDGGYAERGVPKGRGARYGSQTRSQRSFENRAAEGEVARWRGGCAVAPLWGLSACPRVQVHAEIFIVTRETSAPRGERLCGRAAQPRFM